jgi:nitrogen fixation protein FixH
MNKRIGLLLRKFIDTKQDGSDRDGVEIFGVFQAETELTASEVLDRQTKPERLTKMVDALMARPVYDKRKKSQPAHPQSTTTRQAAPATGFDDMDDDIPF